MKDFIIDHIDPLGQGVYKENDQIYFIPKTLPGEKGQFKITKSQRGVNFGELTSLQTKSPQRISSECPHFNECSGCQFLHTDYQSEIQFKFSSFKKLLKVIEADHVDSKIITSDKRLGYRNRIQLHYNIKANVIGFKKTKSNQILPVPRCSVMDEKVSEAYKELLKNWQSTARKQRKNNGHVEIYNIGTTVKVSWNKSYAEGGFTQVNQGVNAKLQELIKDIFSHSSSSILDLFGGKGNLSENLPFDSRLCIDLYPDNEQKNENPFFHLDLFDEGSMKEFSKKHPKISFDSFIIDPPRSGFKYMNDWVNNYMPQHILYVSCHPATMVRDLKNLSQNYKIKKTYMIDLFPSTYHYEAMILLEKV
jgi:23S rRNA (uracil1939-C5)-methyltransferase